jgi:hypothetical protein
MSDQDFNNAVNSETSQDSETVTIHVPKEQIWQYHMLKEQTKLLSSIKSMVKFFFVLTIIYLVVAIIYILVTACSALL